MNQRFQTTTNLGLTVTAEDKRRYYEAVSQTVELKIHRCIQCEKKDEINVGQTSVGCHRCERYCIGTSTATAVWSWNLQNQLP